MQKQIYISKNEVVSVNLFMCLVNILKYINKYETDLGVNYIQELAFIDNDHILIRFVNIVTGETRTERVVYTDVDDDKKNHTFFHSSINPNWCIGNILATANQYNFIGPDELNKYEASTNEIRYMFINILKDLLGIQDMDPTLDRNLKDAIYITSCFLEGQHDDLIEKCPPNILIASYLMMFRSMHTSVSCIHKIDGVIVKILQDNKSCTSLKSFLDIVNSECSSIYNIRNITPEYRDYLNYYFATNGKAGVDFITAVRVFCFFIITCTDSDFDNLPSEVRIRIPFNFNLKSEIPYKKIYNKLLRKYMFKLFNIHDMVNIVSIVLDTHRVDEKGEYTILVTDPDNISAVYFDNKTKKIPNARVEIVSDEKMYMRRIEDKEMKRK